MTVEQHQQADRLAALMVYQKGLPLGFFDDQVMLNFLKYLQPAYTPPTRRQLAEGLLDTEYEAVKAHVDEAIDQELNLNIQFNESKNSAHNRILNITVGTAAGAFYYNNIDIAAATLSASMMATTIEEECVKICKSDLSRINSIAGDTCSTNLAIFKQLQSQPTLKHSFFIPCDAHSLQLLIKDICNHNTMKDIVATADNLVSHFKHSPK